MNYLSGAETQANVAVLWVVARWLARVGECSLASLSTVLRPRPVVEGAENALRASLLVGRHIGILDAADESGPWSLGPRLPESAVVDHRSFRAAVRDALLSQGVEDALADRQPADVALGLAWLCRLDPIRPLAWGWDQTEITVKEAKLGQVIKTNEQWRAFRRWAMSLGMAVGSTPRRAVEVLIPDPTIAVEDVLPRLAPRASAPEFLASLAKELPVVDTGVLERVLSDLGVGYEARGDATIGPVVSYSLRRLDRRGTLSLKKSADASRRVSVRLGAGTDTFDEVIIAESPHG